MSIPMERMTPEEIDRLRMRHTNRDGTAEVLCSKAWAHIQLLEKEARFTAISVLPEKDAEIERLRAALEGVMVGGNSLATIIGADHPPHGTPHRDAIAHYGSGVKYEAWCCWNAIMQARAALEEKS